MDAEFLIVFTTCSSEEEAATIAKAAVEQKAAACCNIVNDVRSVYVWEGEVNDDREVLLLSKTPANTFPRLRDLIEQLHSYDVPEIVAVPIITGNKEYLTWIDSQTE